VIGHALIRFPDGGEITREDWEAFCKPREIAYAPGAAGRNVYYFGGRQGVECAFGEGVRGVGHETAGAPDRAGQVVFTTIWGGERKRDLARIAREFWVWFGGSMFADEDTRQAICEGDSRPA
jgi:hypothetical protein